MANVGQHAMLELARAIALVERSGFRVVALDDAPNAERPPLSLSRAEPAPQGLASSGATGSALETDLLVLDMSDPPETAPTRAIDEDASDDEEDAAALAAVGRLSKKDQAELDARVRALPDHHHRLIDPKPVPKDKQKLPRLVISVGGVS